MTWSVVSVFIYVLGLERDRAVVFPLCNHCLLDTYGSCITIPTGYLLWMEIEAAYMCTVCVCVSVNVQQDLTIGLYSVWGSNTHLSESKTHSHPQYPVYCVIHLGISVV